MTETTKNKIAPCGLDCCNCELYAENPNEAVVEQVAAMLGKDKSQVLCKGCRLQGGCTMYPDCKTLACAQEKNVDFCYECSQFPCTYLMPMADGANRYPHNMKVYNLCRMKTIGIEKWMEETQENRLKYYKGTFKHGEGPQM